jgi:hypothetical protein
MSKDLTIIVVEYFSRPHLDTLAKSIRTFEPELPVIVSSNSNYDVSAQKQMAQDFPETQWLHNGKNLGYAGAVNRALSKVATPYAVILNPDVELVELFADKTRSIFESNQQLAIFGPRILDGKGVATFSFRRFYLPSYIMSRYLGIVPGVTKKKINDYYLMADSSREQFTYADWVSGGAMFVRMAAVKAAGRMDERYFLYMEDVDWCRLFWSKGWRVAYHPEIKVIHRAQHQNTRGGLWHALSPATRHHFMSYLKYLMKWGLNKYNPADDFNKKLN